MSFEKLFSPIKIGKLEIKNRIVMTAAEFSLGQIDGTPTERMMDYYEERAKGEVGLIIPGICRVNDMGAASTFTQLSMSSDRHIEPMREMARRIHSHGAKLCIQLHHPGRQGYASSINSLPLITPMVKAFPGLPGLLFKTTPVLLGLEQRKICFSMQAPSDCELSAHGATRIHAMSKKEIKSLINDFIDAAVRCKKADVDAVELHSTHGYILHQFLSPNTNKRTDEYGGSFENRLRFISEIINGIKEKCGKDYPLIVRLTVDEMYDKIGKPGKGYGLEEGIKIAKALEKLGIDAIDVSCACYDTYNYWLEPTSFETGWRAYLAKAVKENVSVPVIAANFIRSPEQAEKQLEEGYQDMVGSARSFICDPHLALKAKEGRTNEIRRCIGCLHCIDSFIRNAGVGKPGECALNPGVGNEKEYLNPVKDGKGRRTVVIGAGPAGLTAAVTLARRGFEVTVFEKNDKPGGQVIAASSGHLKEKLYWCIEDMMTEAENLGTEFRFNTEANENNVRELDPYAIILATGSKPVMPRSVKGIESDNVFTAPDILLRKTVIENKKVAVIGSGLTGLETAEFLAMCGNEVIIIEAAGTVAPSAWFQHVDDSLSRLIPLGVTIKTSSLLVSIGNKEIVVKSASGTSETLECDAVVMAVEVKSDKSLLDDMQNITVNTFICGDAYKGGSIGKANLDAYKTAMCII
ncbi:MAG: FAD-dependent oxidoreductase [Clostridia bacterium]|nr:FAD-dependent oxidoreductase [Clostridia bacterium]